MTGYASDVPVPNKRGVWYFTQVYQCPVCGRCEVYRTRMSGPAPPKVDRYEFREAYDYCDYG